MLVAAMVLIAVRALDPGRRCAQLMPAAGLVAAMLAPLGGDRARLARLPRLRAAPGRDPVAGGARHGPRDRARRLARRPLRAGRGGPDRRRRRPGRLPASSRHELTATGPGATGSSAGSTAAPARPRRACAGSGALDETAGIVARDAHRPDRRRRPRTARRRASPTSASASTCA